MNTNQKLVLIKSVHTLIWVFYNCVIFYMFYAVVTNKLDNRFWICFGMVLLEGIILAIFRLTCPLTLLARRYSDSKKNNFDIYLPDWLAKYTKLIYSFLFMIIVVIMISRLLK